MNKSDIDWKLTLYDTSKKCIGSAVDLVVSKPELIDELIILISSGEGKIPNRASKVLSFSLDRMRYLAPKFHHRIIELIEIIDNESIRFSLLRIFSQGSISKSEDDISRLFQICLKIIESHTERIAQKVYATDILYKIYKKYPEMKHEIIEILRLYSRYAPISFRSRADKTIRMMLKLK